VTDRNEIGNGAERVAALLRGERLQAEVATVAGEPDPESELIGSLDRIHWTPLFVCVFTLACSLLYCAFCYAPSLTLVVVRFD